MSIFDGIRRFFGGNGREGRAAGSGGPEPTEMITCEEALTFIHDFLDGELEGVTRERVEAHFEVCGRCYPQLQMEEAYRAAVRRACSGQEAPAALKDRVRELLAEAEEE